MNKSRQRFKIYLRRIQALLFTQRSARLILRSLWTGTAGFLIGWGLSTLLGILDDPWLWFLLALAAAAPSLLAVFRPLRLGNLVWGLDRRMGLQEQVTTAWARERTGRDPTPVEGLLLDDAAALLPKTEARILRKGWFLGRDAESALVVLILAIAILWSRQFEQTFSIPEVTPLSVPGLEQAPGAEDVFPSGIPGLTAPPDGGESGNAGDGSGQMSPEQAGLLDSILSNLGAALSDNPETAETGEALENGDLEGAAAAVERTADNVDLLPGETRQDLADALQQAAQEAEQAGEQDLAEDLQAAAQALENPDPNSPIAADALDQLADALRDLAEQFAAMAQGAEDDPGSAPPNQPPDVGSSEGASGAGSGGGTSGAPEPITRLAGEGGSLEFEGGEEPSGLLAPGDSTGPIAPPTGVSTTSTGSGAAEDTEVINSVLTPYHFPWRWRDVVSEYFSPEN